MADKYLTRGFVYRCNLHQNSANVMDLRLQRTILVRSVFLFRNIPVISMT